MSYTVDYHSEKRCIMVEINGELSLELLKNIAMDVAKFAKGNSCKCIINDLRMAKLTLKVHDVVNMPKMAQNSGVNGSFKRALIVGDRAGEFKFLETVFLNQGHIVKMFRTMEEGESWLFDQS